jgi:putative tryptophan/tyrosine transport system substrate-binding protein
MRRRKFLTLLGGAAVAYPLVARADKTRRLGVLMAFHADDLEGRNRLTAVVQALQKFGWTADSNIQIDVRWAGDDVDLSHRYAEELVALTPDVLLASGSTSVVALQRVARSVAILFVNVIDPVGAGFVSSLARPGGNTTGFVAFEYNISGKWLELLKKLAPQTTRIAVLRDPAIASGIGQFAVIQSAASSPDIDLTVIDSRDANEIERSLATFGREPNGGIIVTGSASAITHRKLIISLSIRYRLPNIYPFRYYTVDGGLASYGPNTFEMFKRSAEYIDRILKGAKPSELPVQAPTKYELVLNLKAAKALGLEIPTSLLATADEVIE